MGQVFSERSNDRVFHARRERCTAAAECRADKCYARRECDFAIGECIANNDRPSATAFLDAREQGARVWLACTDSIATDNAGKARLPSQGEHQFACKLLELVGADANLDFGRCLGIKYVFEVLGARRVISDATS